MSDFIYDVLGLGVQSMASGSHNDKLDGTIRLLIEMRDSARANENYVVSDQIRDRLAILNIQLEDAKDGTRFKYWCKVWMHQEWVMLDQIVNSKNFTV